MTESTADWVLRQGEGLAASLSHDLGRCGDDPDALENIRDTADRLQALFRAVRMDTETAQLGWQHKHGTTT